MLTHEALEPAPAAASEEHAGFQRLADGVRSLRVGGALRLSERSLMVVGGIIAPLGLLLVLLGWYGAAHTPNLYEQVPYLISGGLLGVGLVFLGAFFYFTHWVTELVKEGRTQSTQLLEAISRLEDTVRREGARPAAVAANGSARPALPAYAEEPDDADGWVAERELVATAKGTMAHRVDCVVVAGKSGLRLVAVSDGYLPCKLCDPYG